MKPCARCRTLQLALWTLGILALAALPFALGACAQTTITFNPNTGDFSYTSPKDLKLTKFKLGFNVTTGKFEMMADSLDANASDPASVQAAVFSKALDKIPSVPIVPIP